MTSSRLTSPIYAHGGRPDADPASVRLLARKFWRERGGAMLTEEELDCLSSAARREIVAVMEARHGRRMRAPEAKEEGGRR